MACPQDSRRSIFPFGNPFRKILPKGSALSPEMLDLLNTFEENLARRLNKLKPAGTEDFLCLSWMRSAMDSLCELHGDIKNLITALELPACDWDEKWIDMYLRNSVNLMDVCIAFSSEISRLKHGGLFLHCAKRDLDNDSATKFLKACSSLDKWRQHIGSINPKLDKAFSIMDSLTESLDLPKVENSSKRKVLMQAIYGVRVVTLFIYSTFAAIFTGSAKKLMDLRVPETFSWAEPFDDLQTFVNSEIRNMHASGNVTFLKELEAVETAVKNLYSIVQGGVESYAEAEVLQSLQLDLENSIEKLSEGLDALGKEVDGFFKVVVTGRDALLSNLRLSGNVSD